MDDIPKCRRWILYEQGHLMPDHVHMLISIPPKYAVSQVVGYIKGKSAIHAYIRHQPVCYFPPIA